MPSIKDISDLESFFTDIRQARHAGQRTQPLRGVHTVTRTGAGDHSERVEVRQWNTTFEAHGASGLLVGQLAGAFRTLEDIASPKLVGKRRGW